MVDVICLYLDVCKMNQSVGIDELSQHCLRTSNFGEGGPLMFPFLIHSNILGIPNFLREPQLSRKQILTVLVSF